MGITIGWHNDDKNIILLTYTRPWDWTDFEAAAKEMIELLDSVNHPVDMIFDIRKAGAPPQGALKRFREVAETNHPNGRWLVFVGGGSIVMRFLDLFTRLYGLTRNVPYFRFVYSMEEALKLIARRQTQPSP
jgi:hypothetical protein